VNNNSYTNAYAVLVQSNTVNDKGKSVGFKVTLVKSSEGSSNTVLVAEGYGQNALHEAFSQLAKELKKQKICCECHKAVEHWDLFEMCPACSKEFRDGADATYRADLAELEASK
jgi:thioredoxin reductase